MKPIAINTMLNHLSMKAFILLATFLPPSVFAGNSGHAWDNAPDGILEILNGGFMRTVAVIVVIFVGAGVMMARVTWETGVRVIAGIIVVFGASAIVDLVISWSDNG